METVIEHIEQLENKTTSENGILLQKFLIGIN